MFVLEDVRTHGAYLGTPLASTLHRHVLHLGNSYVELVAGVDERFLDVEWSESRFGEEGDLGVALDVVGVIVGAIDPLFEDLFVGAWVLVVFLRGGCGNCCCGFC